MFHTKDVFRFCVSLSLAYEYCDKLKDYKKSLEHIAFCEEHLQFLTKMDCQDRFFTSISSALWHVTLATKANILHLSKASNPDIKVNIKLHIRIHGSCIIIYTSIFSVINKCPYSNNERTDKYLKNTVIFSLNEM